MAPGPTDPQAERGPAGRLGLDTDSSWMKQSMMPPARLPPLSHGSSQRVCVYGKNTFTQKVVFCAPCASCLLISQHVLEPVANQYKKVTLVIYHG